MIFAVGMPSPNTVCVPSFQRSHALQFLEAFRNSSNDACNGNKELIESSGTRLGMLVRCKIDSDGHIEWITRGNLRVDNRRGFVENFGRRRKSEYIASNFFPPDPLMAVNLATLRSKVELALAGRVAAPFTYRDRHVIETVSTGIAEIDLLAGGLPRGALTEIFGP